jgi:DNA-directed RNA polymerase subunit RPC12/RpoP
MLPLRCPYCPFTDRYEVEERSGGFWNYKYTCKNCGHAFGSDMSPDNVKRALNNTRLIFNWNQKSDLWERERTGCETQDGSDSKDTMESEEPNSNDIDESEQTERSQVKLVDY